MSQAGFRSPRSQRSARDVPSSPVPSPEREEMYSIPEPEDQESVEQNPDRLFASRIFVAFAHMFDPRIPVTPIPEVEPQEPSSQYPEFHSDLCDYRLREVINSDYAAREDIISKLESSEEKINKTTSDKDATVLFGQPLAIRLAAPHMSQREAQRRIAERRAKMERSNYIRRRNAAAQREENRKKELERSRKADEDLETSRKAKLEDEYAERKAKVESIRRIQQEERERRRRAREEEKRIEDETLEQMKTISYRSPRHEQFTTRSSAAEDTRRKRIVKEMSTRRSGLSSPRTQRSCLDI